MTIQMERPTQIDLTPPLDPPRLPQLHTWTREEYDRMTERGLFDGQHVELIEGQVLEMAPMGSAHATAVGLAIEALRSLFGSGILIRGQMALDLGALGQPEPDVAVVSGPVRKYQDQHPTGALLVVEVAESSLAYDRTHKTRLYAQAGIADYWLINLPDGQLEVYRRPSPTGYAERTILRAGDVIHPLAAPHSGLRVADLLL